MLVSELSGCGTIFPVQTLQFESNKCFPCWSVVSGRIEDKTSALGSILTGASSFFGCEKIKATYYMSLIMRIPAFCICENKDADKLRGDREPISALVFAKQIVQSLFFLDTKLPASSHLVWLYSLVCVRPGQKPQRPVFSQAHIDFCLSLCATKSPVLKISFSPDMWVYTPRARNYFWDLLVLWGEWSKFFTRPYSSCTRP